MNERINCVRILEEVDQIQPDMGDSLVTQLYREHDAERYIAWLEVQVRALAAHHMQFTRDDVDLLRAFTATDDTRLPQNWLGAGRKLIAKLDAMLPPKPPEKTNA